MSEDTSRFATDFGQVITMDARRFAERVFRNAAASIAQAKSVLDQYEDCWCPAILGPEVLDILEACDVLRAKVDDDFAPRLIHTLRGMGYVMEIR
jgi:hypothetical protein